MIAAAPRKKPNGELAIRAWRNGKSFRRGWPTSLAASWAISSRVPSIQRS